VPEKGKEGTVGLKYERALADAIHRLEYVSQQLHEESLFSGLDEESPGGPIVGIDLGTTNSCCAILQDKKAVIIPSHAGHNTIPSVVAIDPMGNALVGHAAMAQMELNPQRTIYGSKRLVGRPFDSPIVQQFRDRFYYNIVPGKNSLAAVEIDGKVFSLEEVSGSILGELRRMAQHYLKENVTRAVITVPAYYNENQRVAVRKAGALAGFKVERILNEPTAAALAYGYFRGKTQRVFVYDLGGGTFDASVMNLQDDMYQVLATGGDTFLGGVDFDTKLMDYVLIEFQLELKKKIEMARVALLRAQHSAEHAKRALSDVKETKIQLPFIGTAENKPVDLDVAVTRGKLEELVLPLVGNTLEVCDEVMIQSGVNQEDLEAVLLVGGQTRMPLVGRMISNHFGKPPHKGVHPDEAVAAGAALLAASLDKTGAVNLVDVLPVPIGVGVPGGKFKEVLPAGNSVNVSRTFTLPSFRDNQSDLHLPVYQGESEAVDENEFLGTLRIRGIPPGPAGSRTIDITFALSPECLLSVTASDREGGSLGEASMLAHETPGQLHFEEDKDALTSRIDTSELEVAVPGKLEADKNKRSSRSFFKKIFSKRQKD
jgi:molecular chaperone DnaK